MSARVTEVIETIISRGNGKEDPIRNVYRYFSKDGKLLAEKDPLRLMELLSSIKMEHGDPLKKGHCLICDAAITFELNERKHVT